MFFLVNNRLKEEQKSDESLTTSKICNSQFKFANTFAGGKDISSNIQNRNIDLVESEICTKNAQKAE